MYFIKYLFDFLKKLKSLFNFTLIYLLRKLNEFKHLYFFTKTFFFNKADPVFGFLNKNWSKYKNISTSIYLFFFSKIQLIFFFF